jgi:excisionase family DNA binding protein
LHHWEIQVVEKEAIRLARDYLYLTVEEVAEILKIARSTVYKFKDMGMPFIKIGRTIRFKDNEVIEWIESHHSASANNESG